MQRVNKFRGQTITKEWVYGYPVPDETGEKWYIVEQVEADASYGEEADLYATGWYEVIPDTVGRCTGLNDKNGKEIYEGDILRDSLSWVFAVEWDDKNARFLGRHTKPRGDTYICYVGREPKAEIIGNIYDNPELLQEADK